MATLMATLGLDRQGFDDGVNGAAGSIENLMNKFGLIVSVGTVIKLASDVRSLTEQLETMSLKTGLSIEEVQKLGFAITQNKGSMRDFERAIVDLGTNAETSAGKFAKWGISLNDVNGNARTMNQLFLAVADRIAATENPAERLAIAMDLMGNAGRRLVPVMQLGSEAIQGIGEKADLATEQAVRAINQMNDAFGQLRLGALVTLANIFGEIANFDGSSIGNIARELGNLLIQIGNGINQVALGFVANLTSGMFDFLGRWGGAFIEIGSGFATTVANGLGEVLQKAGTFIPVVGGGISAGGALLQGVDLTGSGKAFELAAKITGSLISGAAEGAAEGSAELAAAARQVANEQRLRRSIEDAFGGAARLGLGEGVAPAATRATTGTAAAQTATQAAAARFALSTSGSIADALKAIKDVNADLVTVQHIGGFTDTVSRSGASVAEQADARNEAKKVLTELRRAAVAQGQLADIDPASNEARIRRDRIAKNLAAAGINDKDLVAGVIAGNFSLSDIINQTMTSGAPLTAAQISGMMQGAAAGSPQVSGAQPATATAGAQQTGGTGNPNTDLARLVDLAITRNTLLDGRYKAQ